MSWHEQELAKICTVFADGDWIESKDQSDTGIRLIQTGNVGFGVFKARDSKARYISEETFSRLRCTEIKEGDILVSRLPDPVGRACILPMLNEKSITAVDCSIIRVKSDLISSKFLNYYCQSPQYFEQIKKNITGATRQRVSRSLLGKTVVPYPSLATQLKIVEKLDAIFSEIERATVATEANVKCAEALFQSYLSEIFEPRQTKKCIELNQVLLKTKNVSPERNPETYFKYVDVSSVSNTDFEITETQYLLGKDAPSRAKKHIQENDILFATVRPTLKRVAIVPSDLNNEVASTGYVVLRAGNDLRTKYLFYYLLSSLFIEKMSELQRGASYPAVTDSDVKNQKINLISLTEQDAVCTKLDSIFSAKNSIEKNQNKKISELFLLKQSILKQAFNGELVEE